MENMKLAAVQLDTIAGEVNHNVHKALNWCRRAFDEGAGYVFTHEGLTADYTPEPLRHARALESSEVHGFALLAREYSGYLALGLNELWRGRPAISMVWFGPDGIIDVYRKSYLWPNRSQCERNGYASFEAWLDDYVPHERGFRLERGVLAPGEGTKVIQVGSLRIGCIICADGSQEAAWDTFRHDKPDLVFWQNNRGNAFSSGQEQKYARELGVAMVATNRCGYSQGHFQQGGTCILADDGSPVALASQEGREEIIFANFAELRR